MPPNLLRLISRARVVMDGPDSFAANMAGARHAATSPWSGLPEPTPRQTETGVYPKGFMTWNGLGILVENPVHTVREGTDPDGTPWRNVMKASYGYFPGTMGADGDEVDVFMGPLPESTTAWVLNQRNADGSFDEHKVLVGFHDERAAVDAYRLSYSAGWDRFGRPVALSLGRLKWWLQNGDHTQELTPESVPMEFHHMDATTPLNINRVFWDSAAMPLCGQTLGGLLYELRQHDATDGLLLDGMTMADLMEGEDGKEVLDALVVQAGRLKPKMDALMRIMEVAGDAVKPIANQISDPIRRFGGAHVGVIFELSDGQTVTAWFHNPDSTPNKLSPADELVSWKWQLNKKDVTIVVAPENGQDLNLREVARRVMRLAAKNSAAFAKANAGRSARMEEIAGLRTKVETLQGELAAIHQQIEVAKVDKESRAATLTENPGAGAGAAWWAEASEDTRVALLKFNGLVPPQIERFKVADYFGQTAGMQVKIDAEAAKAADAQRNNEPSDADKAYMVQTAYAFDNASTEFLAWLYESMDKDSYSPFVTARDMDRAAKSLGAGVVWDFFTGHHTLTDAVGGTFDISRNAAALGLKWSLKNLTLHDGDEHGWFKPFDNKAEATQFLREAIVVYRDESPAAAKEWLKKNRMGWKPSASMDAASGRADKRNPLMVQMTDGGVKTGKLTPEDFMKAAKAPRGMFLEKAVQEFNAWKEKNGEPERAEVILNKLDAASEEGDDDVKPTPPAGSPDNTQKGSDAAAAAAKKEGEDDGKEAKPADDKKPAPDSDEAKKAEANSGSEDDDDTDAEAEFEAAPEEDEQGEKPTMDGDFPGHPFRGNQYVHAGEHSKGAVHASMRAKHSEKSGNKASQRKSHAAAFHAHSAAAIGSKGKARGYHKKMAKFHAGRAGMRHDGIVLDAAQKLAVQEALTMAVRMRGAGAVLDSVGDFDGAIAELEIALSTVATNEPINRAAGNVDQADLEASNARSFRKALTILKGKGAMLDGIPSLDGQEYVGRVIKGGAEVGRIDIAGDGKAMVYIGESGDERVKTARGNTYFYSDDDAVDMVHALLKPAKNSTADDLFDQYREKVQAALESMGSTTSDAQGVIDANLDQLRKFFADGKGPSSAAAELGNVTPSGQTSLPYWVMMGDQSVSEHGTIEEAVAAGEKVAATDPFAHEGVWVADAEGNSVREIRAAGLETKPTPPAVEDSNAFDIAFLKDVNGGAHDSLTLDDLLAKIEAAVQALQAAGKLTGENETLANNAITRWVDLDQKANG